MSDVNAVGCHVDEHDGPRRCLRIVATLQKKIPLRAIGNPPVIRHHAVRVARDARLASVGVALGVGLRQVNVTPAAHFLAHEARRHPADARPFLGAQVDALADYQNVQAVGQVQLPVGRALARFDELAEVRPKIGVDAGQLFVAQPAAHLAVKGPAHIIPPLALVAALGAHQAGGPLPLECDQEAVERAPA